MCIWEIEMDFKSMRTLWYTALYLCIWEEEHCMLVGLCGFTQDPLQILVPFSLGVWFADFNLERNNKLWILNTLPAMHFRLIFWQNSNKNSNLFLMGEEQSFWKGCVNRCKYIEPGYPGYFAYISSTENCWSEKKVSGPSSQDEFARIHDMRRNFSGCNESFVSKYWWQGNVAAAADRGPLYIW